MAITGGIVEYFPGDRITCTVKAAQSVSGGDLVELTADREVQPAGAGSVVVLGVALYDAAAGKPVTVATRGVWPIKAAGAITQGARLEAAAAGDARTLQTTDTTGSLDPRCKIGIALEDIADTATGRVLLTP